MRGSRLPILRMRYTPYAKTVYITVYMAFGIVGAGIAIEPIMFDTSSDFRYGIERFATK